MSDGLLIPIPSPLLGTLVTSITGTQTHTTTGAWTDVPGLATLSITGAVGDIVIASARGTSSANSGSFSTNFYHFLHTLPDASTEAPFVTSSNVPNVIGTFVLTQNGTHTFKMQYYFTGVAPSVTFNPASMVAGFPNSYSIFTIDHRSPLG